MFSSDMPTDSNENPTVASSSSSSSHPTRSTSPSRQVNKLKRFLSTLYHFGSDLSRDVAERVRTLILALLVSLTSILVCVCVLDLRTRPADRSLSYCLIREGEGVILVDEDEESELIRPRRVFRHRRLSEQRALSRRIPCESPSDNEFPTATFRLAIPQGKTRATAADGLNSPSRLFQSTLPLLQKDLAHLARQSKQSTSQYLAQHEDLILLPRDALETPGSHPSTANAHENGKRKLADE